ncbi:hypothetical protein FRC11_014837, partial [Ceratobasidium sp. 423]
GTESEGLLAPQPTKRPKPLDSTKSPSPVDTGRVEVSESNIGGISTTPSPTIGLPTPNVLIINTPPIWARFDDTDYEFSAFIQSPRLAFNSPMGRIETIDDPLQSSASLSPTRGTTSTNFTGSSGDSNTSTGLVPRSGMGSAGSASASSFNTAPLEPRPPNSDISTLYAAIRRTLPPALPPSQTPANLVPHNPVTVVTWAPNLSLVQVAPQSESVSRASSVALIDSVSHSGSMSRASSVSRADSGFYVNSTAPATQDLARATGPHESAIPRRRVLRQKDFVFDQVKFMSYMKRRWHWYLIVENAFPTSTHEAQQLCIQYAEQVMGVTHKDLGIGHNAFEFVRGKDSGIRNSFLTGLLSNVENQYGVNTKSTQRLDELISSGNFAHTTYDPITKKITGRFRHPCLMNVVKAILYAKRARTKPIGFVFMPELMGHTHTNDNSEDAPAPNQIAGAPIPMIALACTVVLYGLKSIRAGDSSIRPRGKSKPLHFTEKKLSTHYLSFMDKLVRYPRIDELRKFYMEFIMGEYLRVRTEVDNDSDGVESDDEVHSDGD